MNKTVCKTLKIAGLSAVAASCFYSHAGTNYYYGPSPVGSISGRVFYNQLTRPHVMSFNLSGQSDGLDDGPVNSLISWNLGDFTGARVPYPFIGTARGIDSYGSSAVGMFDVIQSDGAIEPVFNVMINSLHFSNNPNYPLSGTYLQHYFDAGAEKPFAHGPTSVLHYSAKFQIPYAYTASGGSAYINKGITFLDTTSGQYFWYLPLLFDTNLKEDTKACTLPNTKILPGECIGYDPGTQAAMVGSRIGEQTAFNTKAAGSYSTTDQTWHGWRWYGYSISYQQMQRMLVELNKSPLVTKKFNTDPAQYSLDMFFVGGEVTRSTHDNPQRAAAVGYSTQGQWLYVSY